MSHRRRRLQFIFTLAAAVAGIVLLSPCRVHASTAVPVTSITPAHGSTSGGTGLVIGGTGFLNVATVTIGGVPAAIFALSPSWVSISATPPHAAGPVNVIVTNPDGGAGAIVFTYFTDDSLVPRSSTIRKVHITELRVLIDGLRVRFGLQPFNWTTDLTVIRAQDIIDLRNALRDTYAAAQTTAPTFTDPDVTLPGITMKAIHITEIRNAIVALGRSPGFFIDVQINSGSNVVGSYPLSILFDNTAVSLNPQDVTGGTGTGFTGTPITVNVSNAGGIVTINSFQTNPSAPSGNFTVARIKFTTLKAGTVNLTLSGVVVTDPTGSITLDPSFLSLSATTITVN
jgi:hypothetical protein